MPQQTSSSASAVMQPLAVPRARERQIYERFLKRVLDVFGSCVCSAFISVVSRRGVAGLDERWGADLLSRRVIGPRGEFNSYKFRTMLRNADAILAADPDLRNSFHKNFKLKSIRV